MAKGNACSFINSNYMGFGTGIVPQRPGLHPAEPWAQLQPGPGASERAGAAQTALSHDHPRHGYTRGGRQPVCQLRRDGRLHAAAGAHAGDLRAGRRSALRTRRPRSTGRASASRRPARAQDGTAAAWRLEEGIPAETVERLRGDGSSGQLDASGHDRALFGRGQIILRDPGTGVLAGGSDPRADGCAMTL